MTTSNTGEFTFRTDASGTKTYKTTENARKAVAKAGFGNLRHFIMTNEEGRFFPVFVGRENLEHGVHFHFHVAG